MRVSFHRAARREAKDAKYWYADRDRNSPELFQEALDLAIATLSQFPESGERHLLGTRRLPLRRVPYALIYRILPGRVSITAVAHARQEQGYWRDRLS